MVSTTSSPHLTPARSCPFEAMAQDILSVVWAAATCPSLVTAIAPAVPPVLAVRNSQDSSAAFCTGTPEENLHFSLNNKSVWWCMCTLLHVVENGRGQAGFRDGFAVAGAGDGAHRLVAVAAAPEQRRVAHATWSLAAGAACRKSHCHAAFFVHCDCSHGSHAWMFTKRNTKNVIIIDYHKNEIIQNLFAFREFAQR